MGAVAGLLLRVARQACFWLAPILGVVAAGFAIHTGMVVHRSVSTTGTVVRLATTPGIGREPIEFAPVFAFLGDDGQTHSIQGRVFSNPPAFKVGNTVPVMYRKNEPENAEVAGFFHVWSTVFLFALTGLLFAGAGYQMLRYERSLRRKVLAGMVRR